MAEHKESLRARFDEEMVTVFRLTLYFGIWFSALNLLIHETQGRTGLPLEAWGFAWIKAALCAKFLLIGQLLIPMPDATKSRLWAVILPRSVMYLLIVIALNLLEEGLRGMMHGHPFAQSLSEYAGGNPLHFLALAWVYWLILLPYLVISRLFALDTAAAVPKTAS